MAYFIDGKAVRGSGYQQTWEKDIPGHIKRGEATWDGMKDKRPADL